MSGAALQRSRGGCSVAFKAAGGGVTRLDRLWQAPPCRVLFPYPEPGEIPTGVLVTTSGGIAGGDRIAIEAAAGPGARAVVTAQAAEKVYRARDAAAATVSVKLSVGEGGWLEWLPQETILFDGARLVRTTAARVAPGGRLMAGEFVVFGRLARGETFASGLLHESWRVRYGDRLVWADALRLEGDGPDSEIPAVLEHSAGFAGARAMFTFIFVAEDAPAFLDFTRRCLQPSLNCEGCYAGATIAGGILIARLLAQSPLTLRRAVAGLWSAFRNEVAGLPASVSRLWFI